MNKRHLLFLLLLSFVITTVAHPVDPSRARLVAFQFLKSLGNEAGPAYETDLVQIPLDSELDGIYVFVPLRGEGYVMVAADDNAYPIIGYSLKRPFRSENLPPHVRDWYGRYQAQIEVLRKEWVIDSSENRALWQSLSQGASLVSRTATSVPPLMATMWDQSPYYNDQCPNYNDSVKCVTGCVATATAQVMKYWNWPTTGLGSYSYTPSGRTTQSANFGATSYDWAHMPNQLTETSTAQEVFAVAQLMSHVGIAVKMSYGLASGAYTISYGKSNYPSSENALQDYFRYKSSLHGICHEHFTDSAWHAILCNEFDNGRPVIFGAYGNGGGHCFVIDGYDANGLVHVNWGWSGYCDGFYRLEALLPIVPTTGNDYYYHFYDDNQALIGIEPNYAAAASSTITALVNNPAWGTVTGGGTVNFGTRTSLKAEATETTRFSHWSDGTLYNPRSCRADGNDLTLTAIFEPVEGTVLGYCDNTYTGFSSGYSGGTEWGVRLPASVLTPGDSLYQVAALFIRPSSNISPSYTLKVYQGGTGSPTTLVYQQAIFQPEIERWNTINLQTPVAVAAGEPMWITIDCTTDRYPMARGFWSGNYGVHMCRRHGSSLWEDNLYDGAFLVRGVFDHIPPEQYCPTPRVVTPLESGLAANDSLMPWHLGRFNSLVEVIVDSAELNGEMQIDRLAFYLDQGAKCFKVVDVYLQPTSRDTFGTVGDLEPYDSVGGVHVYSGILSMYNGWNTIQFDTPFHYDGRGNVLVIFDAGSNYSFTASRLFSTREGTAAKAAGIYGDHPIGVDSPASAAGTGFVSTRVPLMKLHGCGPHPDIIRVPYEYCQDCTISLTPNQAAWGECVGMGVFHKGKSYQVMAIPRAGHRFVQWSDGNTNNPRTVYLTSDLTLTAIFE